jgi:hypothetical protein
MPCEEVKKDNDSGGFLGCDCMILSALLSSHEFFNRSLEDVCLFFGLGSAAWAEAQMKHQMRCWGIDEFLHAAF